MRVWYGPGIDRCCDYQLCIFLVSRTIDAMFNCAHCITMNWSIFVWNNKESRMILYFKKDDRLDERR